MRVASILAATAAFVLLGAQGALAQTPPGPPPMPRPEGPVHVRVFVQSPASAFLGVLRAAHLSPAQQAHVQQILRSSSQQAEKLATRLRGVQERISSKLLGAAAVSAADLKPLARETLNIRQEMDQNMIDTSLAIRNVLKPEQLSRLADVHRKLERLRNQIEKLIGPGPGGMVLLPPN